MEENKQEDNKILEKLLSPFLVVQNYFAGLLASDKKPLGEKVQTKVREKLHPILSPLSSWVADNVVKYFEQKTSAKEIEEANQKGTAHFLKQAKAYVGSLYTNLTTHFQKTNPEKADRTKPTILCGINSILDRGKIATQKLFNSHTEEKAKTKEARAKTA